MSFTIVLLPVGSALGAKIPKAAGKIKKHPASKVGDILKCEPNKLCLDSAFSESGRTDSENLTLNISGAVLSNGNNDIQFDSMILCFEKFRLDSAFICTRRILDFKANAPREAKGRRLYRSETDEFIRRLISEEWDFIRFEYSEKSSVCRAVFDIAFSEKGEMFTVNISCGKISAQSSGNGRIIPKKKKTLRERIFSAFQGKNPEKNQRMPYTARCRKNSRPPTSK